MICSVKQVGTVWWRSNFLECNHWHVSLMSCMASIALLQYVPSLVSHTCLHLHYKEASEVLTGMKQSTCEGNISLQLQMKANALIVPAWTWDLTSGNPHHNSMTLSDSISAAVQYRATRPFHPVTVGVCLTTSSKHIARQYHNVEELRDFQLVCPAHSHTIATQKMENKNRVT